MEVSYVGYIAIPGSLLAIIGVIAIFMKIGRKDQQLMDQSNKLKEHTDVLKKCGDKKVISVEECEKIQGACVTRQKEDNLKIISDIADLKNDVKNNRLEVLQEVKHDRETVHQELMKLTQIVGKIDGAVGRLRIDPDGRVIP